MRYGIISDIHANLEAFEAVLKPLEKSKIDKYICSGDIVGYGADPTRCIDIVKDLGATVILGNHEAGCIDQRALTYFNENAKKAIVWTKNELRPGDIEYIGNMKYIEHEDGLFSVVHGTLAEPEAFGYMFDKTQADISFSKLDLPLLFIGHSHVPGIFEHKREKVKYYSKEKTKMSKKSRYIVNAGSVGQPRDGDPRACYVVYDSDLGTVEIKRTDYDIRTAQRKIEGSGLPGFLGQRLNAGL